MVRCLLRMGKKRPCNFQVCAFDMFIDIRKFLYCVSRHGTYIIFELMKVPNVRCPNLKFPTILLKFSLIIWDY